jgi:hypothetical protein
LRGGQITEDNRVPDGYSLVEQRLDETEAGEGTVAILINQTRPTEWTETTNPQDCAARLGMNPWAGDSLSWDLFEAVLSPGDLILLMT